MLYHQFSQFTGAKVQPFDIFLEASALEELLQEIVFFFGGERVLKPQLSASQLLKGNSKIIFRLRCSHQLLDFSLLGFGSAMKTKLRQG